MAIETDEPPRGGSFFWNHENRLGKLETEVQLLKAARRDQIHDAQRRQTWAVVLAAGTMGLLGSIVSSVLTVILTVKR